MTEAEKQPEHEEPRQNSTTEAVPSSTLSGLGAAVAGPIASAENDQKEPGAAQTEDTDQMGPRPADTEGAEAAEIARFNKEVKRRMRQKTRRSFLVGGMAALAGAGGWYWLTSRREDDGVPWPFRRALEINEQLARDYFRRGRMSPAFPRQAALEDRVNGDVGLEKEIDISTWKLTIEGLAAADQPLMLALDAIKRMPRVEMTTELKCIEGWSVVVRWAGVRFSDFMAAYPPASAEGGPVNLSRNGADLPPYVSMETPDGSYYVGLEIESMLHPQTLLCYEMNGAPLTQEHGAPLRLVIPVKYGVKNIKRIGTISYMRHRPADYWAEQGYDWYIGL